MRILVNIQNEQEEKVLLAFLDSLHYKYQAHLSTFATSKSSNLSGRQAQKK